MSAVPHPTPLDAGSLDHLAESVAVPQYSRSALQPSIVHLGVGGFHRAHLATYVHELCIGGHTEWGIVGAGVLAGDARMAEALVPQDHLYTLITRGADETTVEVVGSIIDYLLASPDTTDLIERIADPATEIVSLTVTEGGYPIDDGSGEYLPDSPNAGPAAAFGILTAGLARRRDVGGKGLTVLSCDNIVGNGHSSRAATLGEADRLGNGLAEWVDANVTFPNGMVDRITPATTDTDRAWLAESFGITDRWPVVTEPFRQWVLEDSFGGRRLPLEELDIIVTDDVEPYEFMKLRLLNAGHSCLAYLSSLDGFETVDTAMSAPHIRDFVAAFLAVEARPVLPDVAGVDLEAYIASLIERFSNPAIGDQISRLCLDGSAKLPKFLLPTIRLQLEADGPIELSALALAGWCEYLATGTPTDLAADPLLDQAIEHARRSKEDPVAFLEFSDVFGDLGGVDRFRSTFADALQRLRTSGVRSTIEETTTR